VGDGAADERAEDAVCRADASAGASLVVLVKGSARTSVKLLARGSVSAGGRSRTVPESADRAGTRNVDRSDSTGTGGAAAGAGVGAETSGKRRAARCEEAACNEQLPPRLREAFVDDARGAEGGAHGGPEGQLIEEGAGRIHREAEHRGDVQLGLARALRDAGEDGEFVGLDDLHDAFLSFT
jgi:hypothetical protein